MGNLTNAAYGGYVNHAPPMFFPSQSCSQTSVQQPTSNSTAQSKRPMWDNTETQILVNKWKENFHHLESVNKNAAWCKIHSAVQTVSDRTLESCKKKVQNLKDNYLTAKKLNQDSGQVLHKPAFYDIFDEIYGTRDVTQIPYFTDVYSKKPTTSASSATVPTPTRSKVEELFKAGKKRPNGDKEKTDKYSKMQKLFKDQEDAHQKFFKEMMEKQIAAEKAEAEKDRNFLRDLFKMEKEK